MQRLIVIVLLFFFWSLSAQAERKIALLIGNEDYPADVGQLTLPHEDVAAIDAALSHVGFEVTTRLDLNEDGMQAAISAFEQSISDAAETGEDVIAFFYYSGHGASATFSGKRKNYLLPAKESITTASELARLGVSLDEMILGFSTSPAKAVFVVTDACRNDLVRAFDKSGVKGFAPTPPRAGMFIAHSTYPGSVAPDDGLFASALARNLRQPGIESINAFKMTNQEVARTRGITDFPTMAYALTEDFCFNGCELPTPEPERIEVGLSDENEAVAFASALMSNTLEDLKAFVETYPTSTSRALIDRKIAEIEAEQARIAEAQLDQYGVFHPSPDITKPITSLKIIGADENFASSEMARTAIQDFYAQFDPSTPRQFKRIVTCPNRVSDTCIAEIGPKIRAPIPYRFRSGVTNYNYHDADTYTYSVEPAFLRSRGSINLSSLENLDSVMDVLFDTLRPLTSESVVSFTINQGDKSNWADLSHFKLTEIMNRARVEGFEANFWTRKDSDLVTLNWLAVERPQNVTMETIEIPAPE